jgi:hypothetical protein
MAIAEEATIQEAIVFEPGERWSYHTRPEDPDSTLIIGRVEEFPNLGTVIHISVVDVNIRSPRAPGGLTHVVHHMPISPEALRASVIQRSGTGSPSPQFADGYQIWRTAVEDGKGGAFSISVREAVEGFESVINSSP